MRQHVPFFSPTSAPPNHAEQVTRIEPLPWRRFLGYVLAAPVLVTAAELGAASPATASLPSPHATALLGLNDIMTAAALPTSGLISVEISQDGTVSLALPRAMMGHGTITSITTLVAEELSVPRKRVHVTLTETRAGPVFTQVTDGSDPIVATHSPIRVAVAVARQRLLEAASAAFDSPVDCLRLHAGVVSDGSGRSLDIGALVARAASTSTIAVAVELAAREDLALIGRSATGSPRGAR